MEEFFQYVGPDGGAVSSSTLLNRERMFVYSSPREKQIERCGELRAGSYFACSSVLYYEDQVWLKIRRGYFSNAKHNGYIRVFFEYHTESARTNDSELPSRQLSSVAAARPAQFRYMRQLPEFPSYMCARDRLILHREPVFRLHSASVTSTSSSESSPRPMQRFLPPVSVFHATECKFNQDFTQLAVKVTSALAGLKGWINASYHKTLIEVEDPTRCGVFCNGRVYLQNVAKRGGKWAGELPVRALPSLQAPKLYSIESYRVVQALERKLLKDRIWVRIQPLQLLQDSREQKREKQEPVAEISENQDEGTRAYQKMGTGPDAWVIERNVHTAQRVLVPWASNCIENVPANDKAERYYRTVYSRRPLPLRRTADLDADIVGYLEPGDVFSSTQRLLNDKGRMWIRVALPWKNSLESSRNEDRDDDDNNGRERSLHNTGDALQGENYEKDHDRVRYGYAIQSNAKTNTCMVQEIPGPGKMNPKEYFQVCLPSDTGSNAKMQENEADGPLALANTIAARVEASAGAKALFHVRNGAFLAATGSVFNAQEKQMWLQVLATELDPVLCVTHEWKLTEAEQNQHVVYFAMAFSNATAYKSVLQPIYRDLTRIDNPLQAENDAGQSLSRVVFSGRASKLFGSHLLRPSTIDLPAALYKMKGSEPRKSDGTVVDQTTGDEDRAQTLKDEIAAWQCQHGNRMTHVVRLLASSSLECLRRPFLACLAHQEAKQRYRPLDQEEEGMEDYVLEDDG